MNHEIILDSNTIFIQYIYVFAAPVSVLCWRSKENHFAWRTYAWTNSWRINSWTERTDIKSTRQDNCFGLLGLFDLHSSFHSHPRSYSTRSAWNCCLQRDVDCLESVFGESSKNVSVTIQSEGTSCEHRRRGVSEWGYVFGAELVVRRLKVHWD